KEGKKATIGGDGAPLTVALLSNRDSDSFDAWSGDRAKDLVALNQRLSTRGSFANSTFAFTSNAWIYDPICGCSTFLPFAGGLASPYGWSYSTCNPYSAVNSNFWSFYWPYPYSGWGYGYGYGFGGGYPGRGSGSGGWSSGGGSGSGGSG